MHQIRRTLKVGAVLAACFVGAVLSGCASRTDLAAAVKPGMTQAEVDEIMRPSGRERSTVKDGDQTIVKYASGDYFVFVDGRVQRHYRHGDSNGR
jgi:hypothetical protein